MNLYFKKNNSIRFFPLLIILVVIMLSIGFSAFQNNLLVSDVGVVVRVQKDIRVTGVYAANSLNGASSYWEDYNHNAITSSFNLPNSNSEITFQTTITNFGNVEMGLLELTGLPNNLKYTIDSNDYEMKSSICDDNNSSKCTLGAVKTINIKISYKDNGYDASNTEYQMNLNFNFKRVYTISYDGFSSVQGLPTSVLEDDSKSITFSNITGIPVAVNVVGANFTYNSPVLSISNVTNNVVVYKKHTITYILNGGVQAVGQVTMVSSNESVTLLDATKDEYNFGGWFNNVDCEGDAIKVLSGVQNDITLYAHWTQYDYFIRHKEFDGTAANIINTGITLYSTENVNRNFRIKFTIDSFDSSYPNTTISKTDAPTILSSMDESGSPWPGFVYRLYTSGGATKYNVKINDSHVTNFEKFYTLNSGIDVEIVREDGVMYTKINSDTYTEVLKYKSNIDTFDVPLTIGGNINENGAYDRLFKGVLSNVSVEFYDGSIMNNQFYYTETKTANSYMLNGTIEFNGTNYIDTGINLFSAENINKDFDIELTLQQVGGNSSQATLINLKDESQNNVWPGVSYRLKSGTSSFEFTGRWPGETTVSVVDSATVPKVITISRKNGVIYYSSGTSNETKLISVPPAALTTGFSSNLTFGASTNSSGNPFRFFSGIVSNISVVLHDNS